MVPLAGWLLAAGAAPARAQVRNVNYTQRSSTFNSGNSSTLSGSLWNGTGAPQLNGEYSGNRVTMSSYERKMSTLNGQVAATSWKEAFQTGPLLPQTMANAQDVLRPQLALESGRFASLNSATDKAALIQRPGAPEKYADAYTFSTGTPTSIHRNMARDISMQDIGRYIFRSSNPSDPGLPVTRAAAGTVGDARVQGTTINTPALFDFGDSTQTTQVRSGASVAPRVVSSDGDRLMLPSRRTSLTPTSSSLAGGAASSGAGLAPSPSARPNAASAPPASPAPGSSNVITGSNPRPLPKSVLESTPQRLKPTITVRVKDDWEE